jgi:putative PEP-CTERM system histidine kinase
MSLIALSYWSAAAAYGALTIVLLVSRERALQGQRVLIAVAGTAVWGAATALILTLAPDLWHELTPISDAGRACLWILCLLAAIPGRAGPRNLKGMMSIAVVLLTVAAVVSPWISTNENSSDLALLALSTIGCLAVEQVFRNSTADQKRVLKSFSWTIGGILIYDLFVFADSTLLNAVNPTLWAPRGLLAAIAVPFFLLSAKRHPDWAETLYVSREFVFYSATLTAVGVYLIAVGAGGFIIREIGGQWGTAIHIAYLVAALCTLAFILSSTHLKAQLRVFITKHFYRNRYDYREEWLRLIRTLSDSRQAVPLDQRSIEALCAIVESDGGQLWLDRDGRSAYEPFGAWRAEFPTQELTERSPLVRFLNENQWVVDSREYERDPEHYQHAFRDEPGALPRDSILFPLMHENEMLGIARLNCSANVRELNFEDHDLLKTAGRQVAAFLAHDRARERLAETQQFEAFNKLSAFVMHDIKNLLAQQALLVNNAKKFGDRAEFVEDMIRTVDNGVQRMRRLLRQLEQGSAGSPRQRVELNKLILRAVSARSDNSNINCSLTERSSVWVRANPEQLSSVLLHVIQNAQEATPADGKVTISLKEAAGDRVCIEVKDTGEGMSAEFVRRKLFKPFETTKGSTGMGIGAYQAREVVRSLGGEMSVASEVGEGTVVTIVLPLESAGAAD